MDLQFLLFDELFGVLVVARLYLSYGMYQTPPQARKDACKNPKKAA
jgi:hypothetical protein